MAGPSVFAPFAAIVADFPIPGPPVSPKETPINWLKSLLPELPTARLATIDWATPFEVLVGELAQIIQDWHGPTELPCLQTRTGQTSGRVALAYDDFEGTLLALQLGYRLAFEAYLHAQSDVGPRPDLLGQARQLLELMRFRQPDAITRMLIQTARKRGVPYFRVGPDARIWQYGQGKHGWHFYEAGHQGDSLTGYLLQRNKVLTTRLVHRLGFPCTKQGVTKSLSGAIQLASQFGYPVVLKPADRGRGIGVTAGVRNDEEVAAAFARANDASPGQVIVEKFISGRDYRLTVHAGDFASAYWRRPAIVIGDGKHTIAELIELENVNREPEVTAGSMVNLSIDADMLANLRSQNLSPNDRVAAGQIVSLRSIANAHAGGTFHEVTDQVHPDNRQMAESIARSFRLQACGVDFITPDIAKSWRDVPCAVIEINATPGIFGNDPELIIDRQFPAPSNGRIPTAVIFSQEPSQANVILPMLRGRYTRVGYADPTISVLNGHERFRAQTTLIERVQGFLLDPVCEGLVIACQPDYILQRGFPIDRCDLCVIEAEIELPGELQTVAMRCSGGLITASIESTLVQWLASAVG